MRHWTTFLAMTLGCGLLSVAAPAAAFEVEILTPGDGEVLQMDDSGVSFQLGVEPAPGLSSLWIAQVRWHFGDGTVEVDDVPYKTFGAIRTFTHPYGHCGAYPVEVTVTDSAGTQQTDAITVLLDGCPADWYSSYQTTEYPKDRENGWSHNVQGVTHDHANWFVTRNYEDDGPQKGMLWKFPVTHDLHDEITEPDPAAGILRSLQPAELVEGGWHHYGDLAYYDGHVYVAVEGGDGPVVAVFRADDLEYVGYAYLDGAGQDGHAPWCAIDQDTGLLYSGCDRIDGTHPIEVYEVHFDAAGQVAFADNLDPFVPLDEAGNPIVFDATDDGIYVQGGDINPLGDLFLVEADGISVFDLWTGIRKHTIPVAYETHWAWYEELEGVTWWDLDANDSAPGIGGQLHLLMLDNDWPAPSDLYFKHFVVGYGYFGEVTCVDPDGDGVCATDDSCLTVADPTQTDTDGDGVGDACDNCPGDWDPSQWDNDLDGAGDECDPCPSDPYDDADGDGYCFFADTCPWDADLTQTDSDGDGVGDPCDICPAHADAGQADTDGDGLGDACDGDDDGDGVDDAEDDCPADPDPFQLDLDMDGIGDACDPCVPENLWAFVHLCPADSAPVGMDDGEVRTQPGDEGDWAPYRFDLNTLVVEAGLMFVPCFDLSDSDLLDDLALYQENGDMDGDGICDPLDGDDDGDGVDDEDDHCVGEGSIVGVDCREGAFHEAPEFRFIDPRPPVDPVLMMLPTARLPLARDTRSISTRTHEISMALELHSRSDLERLMDRARR